MARDVNGDDVIDLAVTTAMGSHFVAVLINDGHGKFALAKGGHSPASKVTREYDWMRHKSRQKNVRPCSSRGAHLESKSLVTLERVWSGSRSSRWLAMAMRICRTYGVGSPGARRRLAFLIPEYFFRANVTNLE